MENSRKKIVDKVILLAGIIIFLALTGGSLREYQKYRRGVEEIEKTSVNIAELQGRKERLEKLLVESEKPEFIERQLREKLGLTKDGEEYTVAPTNEPKVIDLKMEEKPRERKLYWGEWLKLLQ